MILQLLALTLLQTPLGAEASPMGARPSHVVRIAGAAAQEGEPGLRMPFTPSEADAFPMAAGPSVGVRIVGAAAQEGEPGLGMPFTLSEADAFPMAVRPSPGVRIAEASPREEEPGFGAPFTLEVALRVAPGIVVFLPDTLYPAPAMASIGRGEWTVSRAPGDSVEVRIAYPVMGFRGGLVELPMLRMATRARAAGEAGDAVRGLGELPGPAGLEGLDLRSVPLGSTRIGPLAEMTAAVENGVVLPRPPADVVGGERSVWMVLAIGLASAAGVGGVGAAVASWWSRRGGSLLARLRGRSPRADALRELDRVRGLDWHRNGRVDDFYAASTDAVRRFAERLEPEWNPALSSSELFAGLEQRLGAPGTARLARAIANAERVKFGSHRPDPSEAEEDWTALREWIRTAPEG